MSQTERLGKKLVPIVGDDMREVLGYLERAQTKEAQLAIEGQIRDIARMVLGPNYNSRLLIPPPPKHVIHGVLTIGSVVYEKPLYHAGINKEELTNHLAVFGRSGGGQSNTVFHLIEQLHDQSVPTLFFDFKGEYRTFLERAKRPVRWYTPLRSLYSLNLNPFTLPEGVEASEYVNKITDLLATAYGLGKANRNMIERLLIMTYEQGITNASATDLERSLELLCEKMREQGYTKTRVNEWRDPVLRLTDTLKRFASNTVPYNPEDLLTEDTVVELGDLGEETQKLIVYTLLLHAYYARKKSDDRGGLKLAIIVEEARHVVSKSNKQSELERLFRLLRNFGIGIIAVDQNPATSSSVILNKSLASSHF